jgi:hypothetical protein
MTNAAISPYRILKRSPQNWGIRKIIRLVPNDTKFTAKADVGTAVTDIDRRPEILPGSFYRELGKNKLKTPLLSTKVSVTASTKGACPQPVQFRNKILDVVFFMFMHRTFWYNCVMLTNKMQFSN